MGKYSELSFTGELGRKMVRNGGVEFRRLVNGSAIEPHCDHDCAILSLPDREVRESSHQNAHLRTPPLNPPYSATQRNPVPASVSNSASSPTQTEIHSEPSFQFAHPESHITATATQSSSSNPIQYVVSIKKFHYSIPIYQNQQEVSTLHKPKPTNTLLAA